MRARNTSCARGEERGKDNSLLAEVLFLLKPLLAWSYFFRTLSLVRLALRACLVFAFVRLRQGSHCRLFMFLSRHKLSCKYVGTFALPGSKGSHVCDKVI